MIDFLNWLKSRPGTNIIILLIYYLIVVLPHEWVGLTVNKVFKGFDRSTYNLFIFILFSLFLLTIVFNLYKRWKQHDGKRKIAFYFMMSLLLVILCFKLLFVINIEAVHFIQYAIFTILAFPLFKNSVSVLAFATFAGFLDELYQYVILSPITSKYYDFNDVILDLIGAGFALIILKLFKYPDQKFEWKYGYKSNTFIGLVFFIAMFFIGYSTDVCAIVDQSTDPAFFTLVKSPELSFWTEPPGPSARFHVLRPLEGIITIVLLWVFYFSINKSIPT